MLPVQIEKLRIFRTIFWVSVREIKRLQEALFVIHATFPPVVYKPAGSVLSEVRNTLPTNQEYIYLRVPSCRTLLATYVGVPLPLMDACIHACTRIRADSSAWCDIYECKRRSMLLHRCCVAASVVLRHAVNWPVPDNRSTTMLMLKSRVQEPYAVPPPSAFVNPADPEGLSAVTALLDSIPSMFADCLSATVSEGEPAASQAALISAVDLAKPNGGKVHMFVSSLPNAGVHRLLPRYRGTHGDTGEGSISTKQDLIAPVDQKWTAAAVSAAEAFVCVDFVSVSYTHLTLPTKA